MSKILRLRSNIPPTSDGNIGICISLLMLILLWATTPYAAAQSTTDSPEYGYGGGQINPSISVVIAVLVSAFLLMVCFAIYIRKCTDDDGSSAASRFAAGGGGSYRRSSLGLDASVIELFPIIAYSAVKDHKIGKGALECAVCLNEFTEEESLRLLPKCDHVFHPECIDAWLASHTTCPVCRDDLKISSREIPGDTETRGELNDALEEQSPTSERCETPDQISINVDDGDGDSEEVETAKKSEIPKKSRQVAEKLPRSHSTGHSLVRPGENRERYTLRLPEGVKRQIISQRLNRTTSCIVVLPREASSRRGYRSSGEDSSHGRSDRLVFFMRSGSVRAPQVWNDEGLTAESEVVIKTRTRPPV